MNGKTIIGAIVGVIAYFGVKYAIGTFFSPSIEDQLDKTRIELIAQLPMKLDENTTLVDAESGPGRQFTYIYKVTGMDDVDGDALAEALRPDLEKAYAGEEMKAFRNEKIAAIYRYNDPQGKLITEIRVGGGEEEKSSE